MTGRLPARRTLIAALAAIAIASLAAAACGGGETPKHPAAKIDKGVEIITDGQTWTDGGLDAVQQALSLLPQHVVTNLGSRYQGRLQVLSNPDSRTLSGWMPYPGGANMYSTNDGSNQIVLYPDQSVRVVLHEMGHAYQLRLTPPGK